MGKGGSGMPTIRNIKMVLDRIDFTKDSGVINSAEKDTLKHPDNYTAAEVKKKAADWPSQ